MEEENQRIIEENLQVIKDQMAQLKEYERTQTESCKNEISFLKEHVIVSQSMSMKLVLSQNKSLEEDNQRIKNENTLLRERECNLDEENNLLKNVIASLKQREKDHHQLLDATALLEMVQRENKNREDTNQHIMNEISVLRERDSTLKNEITWLKENDMIHQQNMERLNIEITLLKDHDMMAHDELLFQTESTRLEDMNQRMLQDREDTLKNEITILKDTFQNEITLLNDSFKNES